MWRTPAASWALHFSTLRTRCREGPSPPALRTAASICRQPLASDFAILESMRRIESFRMHPIYLELTLMKSSIWKLGFVLLVAAFAFGTSPRSAGSQELSFRIPPVKIENQPIAITASGFISRVAAERGQNVFKLELIADLSDLQQNITQVLRSQLDKSDRCGER